VKEAERKQYDTVIVDTAGRLGVDAELMKQAVTSARPSTPTRCCSSSTP
jgi:signal recognition particle subunit FFH/SRP54 (srp54)